jgi:hypothetical protein
LLSFLVSKFFLFWNRCIVSFLFFQLPFLFKLVNFFSLPPLTSFSFGMNEQFISFFYLHHPFFVMPMNYFSFSTFNLFHFRMCTQMFFCFPTSLCRNQWTNVFFPLITFSYGMVHNWFLFFQPSFPLEWVECLFFFFFFLTSFCSFTMGVDYFLILWIFKK